MSDVSVNTPGSASVTVPSVIDASTSSVKIGDGSRTAQITAGSELLVNDSVLNAKIPAVGQKTSVASIPVVMASDYVPPAQTILINHVDDSVKIGDGVRFISISATNALKTDSSAVTQPISGTVAISSSPATGFSTINVSGFVVVQSTSTQLLASNSARKYAHIINNSSTPVFIQFGAAAVTGRGIKLTVGAMYTMSGYELFLGAINAISTTTTNIDILEGI
jgi:hypothetical protein